jgi:hypothetical protein
MTAIHENYKLTTNGASFMRRFYGGNSFQMVFLRENKIANLNTKTGTWSTRTNS